MPPYVEFKSKTKIDRSKRRHTVNHGLEHVLDGPRFDIRTAPIHGLNVCNEVNDCRMVGRALLTERIEMRSHQRWQKTKTLPNIRPP